MIKIINGVITITEDPKGKCDLCGKIDELRPYGPNEENICFECGMKHRSTTIQKCSEKILKSILVDYITNKN
jgi:hypothetical protein